MKQRGELHWSNNLTQSRSVAISSIGCKPTARPKLRELEALHVFGGSDLVSSPGLCTSRQFGVAVDRRLVVEKSTGASDIKVVVHRQLRCDKSRHRRFAFNSQQSIAGLQHPAESIGSGIGDRALGNGDAGDLQDTAQKEGMDTMYEDGQRKAVAGLTTIEEVLRVTTQQEQEA